MIEKTYCVLVVLYDPQNTYSAGAYQQMREALNTPGVVQINGTTFVVAIPDAIPALLAAAAVEIRSLHETRRLRFCLIPCGSSVYGELPKEVAKPLASLGLSYLETPFPEPQQRH